MHTTWKQFYTIFLVQLQFKCHLSGDTMSVLNHFQIFGSSWSSVFQVKFAQTVPLFAKHHVFLWSLNSVQHQSLCLNNLQVNAVSCQFYDNLWQRKRKWLYKENSQCLNHDEYQHLVIWGHWTRKVRYVRESGCYNSRNERSKETFSPCCKILQSKAAKE